VGSIPAWRTKFFLVCKLEKKHKVIEEQIEEGKTDAVLSYIPFLCFIPLFKSNLNNFAKKHVKQGLLLLIIEIVALFFLVDFLNDIFWTLVLIVCCIFAFTGISKSLAGKEMKIPFIGDIFEKYDI
jgi:uncharacterized membrane protein